MGLFDIPGTSWVQVGELGLAFIVVILSSSLVTFVVKTSAKRENELLKIIEKVLPVMEKTSAGMTNINLRLESIEDNQMQLWAHKAPRKKTSDTIAEIVEEVKRGDLFVERVYSFCGAISNLIPPGHDF